MSQEVKIQSHKNLDYSKKVESSPHYKMQRISPDSATVLALNGTSQASFSIPATVLNLSMSKIRFDLTFAAPGNGLFNKVRLGGLTPIDSIRLESRSGLIISEIRDCAHFTQVINPFINTIDEYVGKPSPEVAVAVGDAQMSDLFGRVGKKITDPMAANQVSGNGVTLTGVLSETGANDFNPSKICSGGADAALSVKVEIDFGRLAHSLFSSPRDLYFAGEQLRLVVNFAPATSYCFTNNAVDTIHTLPAAIAAAPQLSKVFLWLANQMNPVISASVKSAFLKGISLPLPAIFANRQNKGTSTASTMTARLSAAQGRTLLKTYVSFFNNVQTLNTAHCNSNIGDGNVLTIRSLVNGVAQRDYALSYNDDLLMAMGPYIKGTPAAQNEASFASTGVYIDSFDGSHTTDWESEHSVFRGIALSEDIDYSVETTSSAQNTDFYVFFVVQRVLSISSAGISVDGL